MNLVKQSPNSYPQQNNSLNKVNSIANSQFINNANKFMTKVSQPKSFQQIDQFKQNFLENSTSCENKVNPNSYQNEFLK